MGRTDITHASHALRLLLLKLLTHRTVVWVGVASDVRREDPVTSRIKTAPRLLLLGPWLERVGVARVAR